VVILGIAWAATKQKTPATILEGATPPAPPAPPGDPATGVGLVKHAVSPRKSSRVRHVWYVSELVCLVRRG
jgi:hypothetical protein